MTAYATLYLANAAPLPLEFLQRMVPFAQVATVPPGNGTAGGYVLTTPSWRLQLNVMPAAQMPHNLDGFSQWVTPGAPDLVSITLGPADAPMLDPQATLQLVATLRRELDETTSARDR